MFPEYLVLLMVRNYLQVQIQKILVHLGFYQDEER